MRIDFKELKKLFPAEEWDLGILAGDYYRECLNSPIKMVSHEFGMNLSENPITSNLKSNGKEITSFLVLARKSTKAYDYSLYAESYQILSTSGYEFVPVYLNFKKSAVLSGMGTVARNSLVYNRKFGFQHKICMYALENGEFYNIDPITVNRNLLDLCTDCNDCIKNCPVNAIHENWIDAKKCDDFLGHGNHPELKSFKWHWWDLVGKYRGKYTKKEVEKWTSYNDSIVEWDGEYSSKDGIVYKNGTPIELPICRRCQEQPKCSKMPYLEEY